MSSLQRLHFQFICSWDLFTLIGWALDFKAVDFNPKMLFVNCVLGNMMKSVRNLLRERDLMLFTYLVSLGYQEVAKKVKILGLVARLK